MRPNLLFIISDNQSPWTLGCYGNTEIRTPNLDRLAAAGMVGDAAWCTNPVCSPNRATLLTGLMPSQHGVHSWLGAERPDAQVGPAAYCTIDEFENLPRTLASAGYRCGMSGKWHLGDSARPQLGFSHWFAKPKGHTVSFDDDEAFHDGGLHPINGYFPTAITDHAIDFLDQQDGSRPFFLYTAYNLPYGLDHDLRKTGHRNRHTEYYADQPLACFPREEAHPWLVANHDLLNRDLAIRGYAAAVSGLDDEVGRLLAALDERGLADNTLVVFTADHGIGTGHHGIWGMADHTRPFAMYDENLRVPLIWRWPGRIPPGRYATPTPNTDFLPTVYELFDLGATPWNLSGRSIAAALLGESMEPPGATFHEYQNARTIRTDRWKFTRRHPDGPNELYDLRQDPGERHNLAGGKWAAKVEAELRERLDLFFARYVVARHDLWHGGRSKAGAGNRRQ